MGNPVVHFEIGCKDAKKGFEFYSKLFDWKIDSESMGGQYGLVAAQAEKSIGGGINQNQEGVPSYVTFYVQVDDLQAYLDKAESLGGKTMLPPTEIPNVGSFAWLTDPEGNAIGLFKG